MSAAAIFLYIQISRGDGRSFERTPHPTYASCFAALGKLRMLAPNGAENEVAVVAWCGGPDEAIDGNGYWAKREP